MVKGEVNIPNKRKSLGGNTPAKKIKIENGNGTSPIKTPKKEPQSPKGNQLVTKKMKQIKVEPSEDVVQAPKGNKQLKKAKQIKVESADGPKAAPQGPKGNQQLTKNVKQNDAGPKGKKNKQNKAGNGNAEESAKGLTVLSNKTVKPFAGTKQLNKPKKQTAPKDGDQPTEGKKRRRNALANLTAQVKAKQGTKDPEVIKALDTRIEAITARGELSKTAKRKLSILNKLKMICIEGSAAVSEKVKLQVAEAKKIAAQKKLQKKEEAEKKGVAAGGKKAAAKAPVPKVAQDEEDEDDDDSEEEAGDSDDDSNEEVEGEDSGEEDDDEDEDDEDDEEDDDDDSDEEEIPIPAPKGKPHCSITQSYSKQSTMGALYSKEIVKKGQKRFVLFVGNIPFDATKEELATHFSKVGDIVDIRIPTEKGSNRPRGFAYIEVNNDTSYEKCLSMHHSQLRGRRINVLYSQGGKKKGDDKKKEIKVKNFKLHALRKQGKLAGSVKESQKRSFRRNKNKVENS